MLKRIHVKTRIAQKGLDKPAIICKTIKNINGQNLYVKEEIGREVEILGPCKIIYNTSAKYKGVRIHVYIETESEVVIS